VSDAYFDDHGTRIAVDWRTPVDELEPEEESGHDAPSAVALVERIAATFTRGDSKITELAWRFLLGAEDQSMRRCAARAGISFAAISPRARIISEEFGLRLRNPHVREMRRKIALAAWQKKKRRARLPDSPLFIEPTLKTSAHGGIHE
jgi:hypothetical protein